jgi:malonyl-CoA O-methyltransferase
MQAEPFFTDPRAVRRHASASAKHFANANALHAEIAARMDARLDYIKLQPSRLVDLGCGIGGALPALRKRFPAADALALDLALSRVQRAAPARTGGWLQQKLKPLFGQNAHSMGICGNMAALPLKTASVQLAWSNLALHWLNDPAPAIAEAHRVLSVGGLFMFSCLGPDTLKELRQAMGHTATPRLHRFVDLHDIGDVLVNAGFANPVMDVELITLTYETAQALHRDLKWSGAQNAAIGRARGLSGHVPPGWLQATTPGSDGRFGITFEVIYGHAWKPEPRRTASGESIIQFKPRTT